MAQAGHFPRAGSVLLVPLSDTQFEAALETHEVDVAAIFLPEGAAPPFLGILRARHAGMLTHWAEIRAVTRESAEASAAHVRLGPLMRFPRPIEWRRPRELYRPIQVDAEALARAQSLDEFLAGGERDAAAAIVQAARFIELAPPRLDLGLVDRHHLVDQAASFAASNPMEALGAIDAAVTEALRDVTAAFYGEAQEGDEARDGWFGSEKFAPTVEAYFELLREADEKELAPLLALTERYLELRTRAKAVTSDLRAQQVVNLIAIAQALLDAAAGG